MARRLSHAATVPTTFFATFAQALNEHFATPFSIVELGSGPGRLAAVLLASCKVNSYVAIDFSDAMHVLAREHLGDSANRVQFATADFRSDWHKAYSHVDAVVTMQAAHEVRHKRRRLSFFTKVRNTLSPSGIFVFCDHYWEPVATNIAIFTLKRRSNPESLLSRGFRLSLYFSIEKVWHFTLADPDASACLGAGPSREIRIETLPKLGTR